MATVMEPKAQPLTEAVGTVIEGIDIGAPLDAATIAFIRSTLVERGVVFFRRQDVTIEQLWSFISHFGKPQKEDSFGTDEDTPADVAVNDLAPTRRGTAVWHTDSSFLATPPTFTILRALKLPPLGGDTCWASMTAAYDALPVPLRAMLDQLSAVHTIDLPMTRLGDYGDDFGSRFRADHAPHQAHPVVAVHPETGHKALYVTESCTSRIVEFEAQQSRHVLAMLFEHIKSPDFNLRWRWTEGDVALWDNRVVQHYAVPDYERERVMQRIIIKGERPVGS
jgi:alpha-ketoglutarate-dependent taurine dioxygenase